MAWMAAGSAAASIGSSLINAFSGGYDSHDNHRGREARQWDETKVRRLVNDAKAAGISPLVALGSSIATPMALPVDAGTYSGSAVGDSLAHLGDTLGSLYSQDQDQAQADKDRAENARQADINAKLQARQNSINADAVAAQKKSLDLDREYKRAMIDEVRSRTHLNMVDAASRGATTGGNTDSAIHSPIGPVGHVPGVDDYDKVAGRYGQILGELYGWWNAFNDLTHRTPGDAGAKEIPKSTVPRTQDIPPGTFHF